MKKPKTIYVITCAGLVIDMETSKKKALDLISKVKNSIKDEIEVVKYELAQ